MQGLGDGGEFVIQGIDDGNGEKMIDIRSSDLAVPAFFVCEIGETIYLPA